VEGNINILQIITDSGPVIKFVLFLLFLASVYSWSIVIKKRKEFKTINENNALFINVFQNSSSFSEINSNAQNIGFSTFKLIFQRGNDELMSLQQSMKNSNYTLTDTKEHYSSFGIGALSRSLDAGINSANSYMDNRLPILASIGSIAPFVGLFGTVWGIINSFRGLSSGNASLSAVAPGIAEALIATAIGLAAAIPALWFFNHFNTKKEQVNADMDSFSKDFLNSVERTLISKI